MKKRQRRLMGLLLACVMTCLPAAQVYAQTDFEASAGVSGQILFPGDSLVNAAGPVMLDGQEASLEEGGIWKNTSDNKVYKATTAEDGTLQITEAGYVLEVNGGFADNADGNASHYEFLDWEKPEGTKDLVCFASGTIVKIKAEDPKDGMEFSGWTTDTEGVTFEDASAKETTLVMPEKKAVIKANYQAVQTEAPQEQPSENPEELITIGEEQVPTEYTVEVVDGSGSGNYLAGDWVTVTANEKEGYEFAGWYVDSMNAELDDLSAASAGFVMPEQNVKVTASYTEIVQAPAEYEVAVNNGTGAGSYQEGAWVTVAANDRQAEGLEFSGWTVDSQNAQLENAAEQMTGFTMPQGAVTLTANYTEIPQEPTAYQLTVIDATAVTADGSSTESCVPGTEITVTANDRSAEGLEFAGWYVEEMNAELDDAMAETAHFTMPEGNTTISATYETAETEAPAEPQDVEEPTETPAEPQDTETPTEPGNETPIEVEPNTVDGAEPETAEAADPVEKVYQVSVENGRGGGECVVGSTVSVEAEEKEGFVFKQWRVNSGNVELADPTQSVTSFIMPEGDVSLTAELEQEVLTYTAVLENAVFTGEDAALTSMEAAKDEEISIQAKDRKNEGLRFTGWSAVSTADDTDVEVIFTDAQAEQTSFRMPELDITIKANYEKIPNTYKVTVSNGLITASSAGLQGSVTELTVEENTDITVKANPSPSGQAFAYWKINNGEFDMGEATWEEEIQITVTQNLEILAVYEGVEYSVNVENGSSDYDTCVSGTTVTLTADDAPEGMEFDCWKVDSGNATLADAYQAKTTFTMPQGDVTVSAHYKKIAYQVTVENGSTGQQYYNAGDTVTVTSNYPANGRVFGQWAAVSGNVKFADASRWKTTFTMPAADVAVKATYKDGPSADNNVIQDIVSGGEYLTGSTIKFTASGAGMDNTNPNPGDYRYRPSGYQIGKVTGTWQAAPYSISMSIKAAGEYTLKVIFNKDVFDGTNWVSEGSSDAKSVTFRVVTKAAGVATGDSTPIMMVVGIAVVSCIIFLILLVVFLRRRRNR